jgi:enoyl-CoA hydratase/carnithine racemase
MTATETRPLEDMLKYEKDVKSKIAYITLNRPDKMNAPTSAMRLRYGELLRQADIDNDVKVVIVRGTGDHLGTGADLPDTMRILNGNPLEEFGLQDEADLEYPPKGTFRHGYSAAALYADARGGCRSLQEVKKVTILEVKGYCYGWHFYQAADADLVIASDDALFGHAAFRYAGLAPRQWQWIETMGLRKFQEMVFTGRPFTAQEMRECNFVNSVVARDKLEGEVQKYALACANGSTDRIVLQKTFFQVYKQHRGEYLGSILAGLFEGLTGYMRAEEGEFAIDADGEMVKNLAKNVKDNDARYPPEWRLSVRGRRTA